MSFAQDVKAAEAKLLELYHNGEKRSPLLVTSLEAVALHAVSSGSAGSVVADVEAKVQEAVDKAEAVLAKVESALAEVKALTPAKPATPSGVA